MSWHQIKKIDKTINYHSAKIRDNELISKNHKRVNFELC